MTNHIDEFNSHVESYDAHVEEINEHVESFEGHINDDSIHTTEEEKTKWDNKLNEVLAGDFISVTNKDTVSVKTESTISNDNTTIPTSQVIYNHSKDVNASDDTDSVHLTKK